MMWVELELRLPTGDDETNAEPLAVLEDALAELGVDDVLLTRESGTDRVTAGWDTDDPWPALTIRLALHRAALRARIPFRPVPAV